MSYHSVLFGISFISRSLHNIFLHFISGTSEHETTGFFRRDQVTVSNERLTYHAHFYDCNEGSNILQICRRFIAGLNCEADLYSNGIHPFVNEDGKCGVLTFLEVFLCFYMHDNPFHRNLITRRLTGNRNEGNHGPVIYDPNRLPVRRNRNIPHNQ